MQMHFVFMTVGLAIIYLFMLFICDVYFFYIVVTNHSLKNEIWSLKKKKNQAFFPCSLLYWLNSWIQSAKCTKKDQV